MDDLIDCLNKHDQTIASNCKEIRIEISEKFGTTKPKNNLELKSFGFGHYLFLIKKEFSMFKNVLSCDTWQIMKR